MSLHAWLTHDYFPHTERLLRRVIYNPLGCLAVATGIALLCGRYLHSHALILCWGLVALMALGVVWPWFGLCGVHGSLHFGRSRVREEEPVEVVLTLRNRLPWAAWGLAVRGGFGEAPPAPDKAPSPPVAGIGVAPGRRVIEVRWRFTPVCRGVYPLGTSRLTTGFPFGLRESKRRLAVTEPLVVWPRTFPVGAVPSVAGENQVEGAVSRHKVGSTGDVLGVRPYRRGDSPRRIHWGQTARHDRLIVCEMQSNARPVVQLVLDADPAVHRGAGPGSSLEWAIRIVASLAEGWLAQGVQIEMVLGGAALPAVAGTAHLHRIFDALARLSGGPGVPLARMLEAPVCRNLSERLQVIVTTDPALRALSDALLRVEGRRFVVLDAESFVGHAAANGDKQRRPAAWLWIDGPERVPYLLRHGWKEAVHGA
jgi:uncharacterized protein (DUF58 family)